MTLLRAYRCALLMLALQASGCALFYKETGTPLETGQVQDVHCGEYPEVAKIVARDLIPDAATSSIVLECALSQISVSNDPALIRSATGAHVNFLLADRSQDITKRRAWASGGVDLAQNALAQGGEEDGAVHYYLAANLGWSVRNQPIAALQSLPRMESELMRSIQMTPELDQGGPLRTLGMLYLKAPPWPSGIGDSDKALELLRQVVEKYPDHPLNHLFYAQALLATQEPNNIGKAGDEWRKGKQLLMTVAFWENNRNSWGVEFSDVADQLLAAHR